MSNSEPIVSSPVFFETLLGSLAAGVVAVDKDGRFIFLNTRAREVTGVDLRDDLRPKDWQQSYGCFETDCKTPFPLEKYPLVRALSGETVKRQQMWLCNSGHPEGIFISINATPLRDKSGEVIGAVAVFEDVSDTHCLEVERRERETILSQQLELKTSEIRRVNEELSRFSSVACHDLKEPVRTIGAFAQLLEKRLAGRIGDEESSWLRDISSRAKELIGFLDELLALARISPSCGDSSELLSLDDILAKVQKHLMVALVDNDARVEIRPLPKIIGEPTPIIQLFQNLLVNCIKYRSDRPLQIEIGADPRGDGWVFWVKDNGVGIPPEYRESVFAPFVSYCVPGRERGSGIGLAICQRVVDRYGGRIWVESEVDVGTTIGFWLPNGRVVAGSLEGRSVPGAVHG